MSFQFIRIPEHTESSDNPPTLVQYWKAVGSANPAFVKAFVQTGTPITVATINGTLFRDDIQLRQVAYNQFEIAVPYGARNRQPSQGLSVGEWTWDFDTTGGSVHITYAKEEVGRYKQGENADFLLGISDDPRLMTEVPDQLGLIGVKPETVEGVDIVIPLMRFGVTYRHPPGAIGIPRARYLASITGSTNSDTFMTFSPGEVLFLGSRGGEGSQTESTVNYQFLASPNALLNIGGIQNIARKGHEVLWVLYEDAEVFTGKSDANGNPEKIATRKPKFAYVDRVYDEVPLATALGFGA
jgi:hypothetical protein